MYNKHVDLPPVPRSSAQTSIGFNRHSSLTLRIMDSAAAILHTPSGTAYPFLVAPQSRFFPTSEGYSLRVYHDVSNAYGAAPFPVAAQGTAVVVLRGSVTLDTKVRSARTAGAAALVIVNTSNDPIGPDLDELCELLVGAVSAAAGAELVAAAASAAGGSGSELLLAPSANVLGCVLCNNLPGLRALVGTAPGPPPPEYVDPLAVKDASGHTALLYAAARPSCWKPSCSCCAAAALTRTLLTL